MTAMTAMTAMTVMTAMTAYPAPLRKPYPWRRPGHRMGKDRPPPGPRQDRPGQAMPGAAVAGIPRRDALRPGHRPPLAGPAGRLPGDLELNAPAFPAPDQVPRPDPQGQEGLPHL
nr:hypothetical protein [Arthrobacter sp. efr-133-R2A-63]